MDGQQPTLHIRENSKSGPLMTPYGLRIYGVGVYSSNLAAVTEKHEVIANSKEQNGEGYLSNKPVSSKEASNDIQNLSNQLNELQQQFSLGLLH